MAHPRLSLVLTDVLSCGLVGSPGPVERELMILGALSDKVPEVARAFPEEAVPDIYAAAQAYHARAIAYSPTPPPLKADSDYPLRPLWEALADGRGVTPGLADEVLGAAAPAEEVQLPEVERCGSLLVVSERLLSVGRTWYALLETLMTREGLYYATALRLLEERRANVLLLTDWRYPEMPPVRHFIPEVYLPRCLGHPAAVWADLDRSEALSFLSAVAQRINHFLGTPGDFEPAAQKLTQRILAPPLVAADTTPL
jgi:hypothetical protein